VAIVVVNAQVDQHYIILSEKKSFFSEIFCCFSNNSSALTYERAPEPSDVYWENLNVTSMQRFLRVVLTYLGTVLIIGICFGIIYGINIAKIELKKIDSVPEWVISALSFLCSFVIIAVNQSLRTVVRTLSIKEKHETYTAYNLSVAFKLTFVRFINTAIVPCIVNISSDRWFVKGGLVEDFSSIMISLSFTEPITYLFDVGALIRYFKRKYYRGQGEKCLMT
jgi:hypothetical protein